MSKSKLPAVCHFQFEPLCWFFNKPDQGYVRDNFQGGFSSGLSNTRVYITVDGLMVIDLQEYENAGELSIDIDNEGGDSILKLHLEKRSKVTNCLRSTLISNILIEKSESLVLFQPITMSSIRTCPNIRSPLNSKIQEGPRLITVERSIISDSVTKFERISENKTYLDICNLIYKAHWEFSQANFTSALIESWTVIEKLLNLKWKSYIEKCKHQGIKINSKRKEKLVKGSGFSAYVLSEFLSLSGNLSQKEYEDISEIRGIRNKWMHDMVQANDESAATALSLSNSMFSELMGFSYRLPISLSVQFITISTQDG